jgi:outer membrane immunogenic protein
MPRSLKAAILSCCIYAATLGLTCEYAVAGFAIPTLNASNSASASSWVAGAQAGYNWQSNSFVYGLEADISAMHLNSVMNTTLLSTPYFVTANANANVDWYGTLRGRLGWSSGPVLFYGTGGLAYGHVNLNSNIFDSNDPLSLSSQASSMRTGWVAGGGIEYMWRPGVILNLGYQYVDLGTINLASSTNDGFIALGQSASARAQFQVLSVGLSWLIPPTAPQGAWQGAYVGGHAGGAWGNSTSANYSDVPVGISDVRLKRDITLVGRLDNGLGLYRYRYLWSDTVYVGVMAQEVALIRPDAIVRDSLDDYLRVDYSRLGLKLMRLHE